ncbi:RHS repeat domain-containing protein [Stenotrophomonas sp. PD6]|uniref:RHS repeat domain-containing protein n=1 Tax=Stenotrophomonas sp. PD6 TaxID=3368612 RepID=UPI003BA19189
MSRRQNGNAGVLLVLRFLMFLGMSICALGASAQGLNTARFRVTATSGTDLVAPGNAALKIDMLDAIVNGVYESIDYSSIYLMRNGEVVVIDINWDSPTTQYYSEQGLAAGTYDFIVMGVAISHDAMGNERYREVQSSPVRFTVAQPSGWLVANPSSCVIPWGGSACTTTVSWSSNAASAQLFISSPSGASPVLIAQGASGSQAVSINTAGARLSLREGPYVLANIDVAAIPTQNQAPQVSLVAPAAHAVIPVGTAVVMQAAASDADDGLARVAFLVDGLQVGVATSAPYTVSAMVSAGAHALVARATDTRGAQVDSAAVPFFVALPPSVSITSPLQNSIRREPGSFVLAAAASDPDGIIQKVEYLANGALVATATSAPFSASVGGLSAGTYSFVARATDSHGLSATSAPVSVSVFASSDGGAGQSVTRRYTYNARHLLCRVEEPETGVTLMGYDPAGNLAWSAAGLPGSAVCGETGGSAEASARRVARTYDARGRLASLSFPDGKGDQVWTYTADGKPSSITVANPGAAATVNTYAYNRRRMLVEESLQLPDGRIWSAAHSYDAQGNRSSLRYPGTGLVVDYSPNALGQPTRAGKFATGVQWHPNGSIKRFDYGNGVVRTIDQNARQLPSRVSDCVGSTGCTGAGTRLDLTYAYDGTGNPVEIADLRNGRQDRSMQYDSADRLVHVSSQMFGEAFYEYDPFDNLRLNVVAAGSGARAHHYCYDEHWRLTNVKVGGCGGATVVGLTYDVQGNLHQRNGQEYRFDFGNRLREVVGKETYSYDGHGRRVLSCDGSGCSNQIYGADGRLLYVDDARKGVVTEHIQLGDGLVALRETAAVTGTISVRYQHADLLGSPIAETDSAGSLTETLEYEPYGQQISGVLKDRPGYAGHVLDAATGLSYMQQRYYDPQVGRFLSVDPVTAYSNPTGAFNRYWYANNNPYRFKDPDGRKCATTDGKGSCTFDEFTDKNGNAMTREQALSGGNRLTRALGIDRGSRILKAEAGMTAKYTATKGLAANGGEVTIKGSSALGIPDQKVSGEAIVGQMENVLTIANDFSKPGNPSSAASTQVALTTGYVSNTPINFWSSGWSSGTAETFGHEILHTLYSGAGVNNGGWTNGLFNLDHQTPFNDASDEIK